MVIAPASTGIANTNKKEVTNKDQVYKGRTCNVIPGARMFITVEIKFIAPKIEAAPERCKLKITKSTEGPE